MFVNLMQTIGVVFSLLLIVVITIMIMYVSYIVGIGLLVIAFTFITYHILASLRDRR